MRKQQMWFIIPVVLMLAGCAQKKCHRFCQKTAGAAHRKKAALAAAQRENFSGRIKDMPLEQALRAKDYYQARGNEEKVAQLLPHIISLTKDAEKIAGYTFELADYNASIGNLEQAQKLYETFVIFYPGNEHIKDVRYRQVVVAFLRSLDAAHDQTITRLALGYAKTYLRDFSEEDDAASVEVQNIICACYKKLLEYELGVVQFYVNKYTYLKRTSTLDAAQGRLQYVQKHILPALECYDQRFKALSDEIIKVLAPHVEDDGQEVKHEEIPVADRVAFLVGMQQRLEALALGLHLDENIKEHAKNMF